MKDLAVTKFEASTLISNLLIVSAVVTAFAPMILGGDRLVQMASGLVSQGSLVLQELSISLQRLLG